MSNDESYALRIGGRNLTDETYYNAIFSSTGDNGVWAAPRSFGITLEAHM